MFPDADLLRDMVGNCCKDSGTQQAGGESDVGVSELRANLDKDWESLRESHPEFSTELQREG